MIYRVIITGPAVTAMTVNLHLHMQQPTQGDPQNVLEQINNPHRQLVDPDGYAQQLPRTHIYTITIC